MEGARAGKSSPKLDELRLPLMFQPSTTPANHMHLRTVKDNWASPRPPRSLPGEPPRIRGSKEYVFGRIETERSRSRYVPRNVVISDNKRRVQKKVLEEVITGYLDHFVDEERMYTSPAVFCEIMLNEVEKELEDLAKPHPVLTAAACECFRRLLPYTGDMKIILERILNVCSSSIYCETAPDECIVDQRLPVFGKRQPFFLEVRRLEIEKQKLAVQNQAVIYALSRRPDMKAFIQRTIRQWQAQELFKSFRKWQFQAIEFAKMQAEIAAKYRRNRDRYSVSRCYQAWKRFIWRSKLDKATKNFDALLKAEEAKWREQNNEMKWRQRLFEAQQEINRLQEELTGAGKGVEGRRREEMRSLTDPILDVLEEAMGIALKDIDVQIEWLLSLNTVDPRQLLVEDTDKAVLFQEKPTSEAGKEAGQEDVSEATGEGDKRNEDNGGDPSAKETVQDGESSTKEQPSAAQREEMGEELTKRACEYLLSLDVPDLLLRWANLQMVRVEKGRSIENFTSDWRDGEVYAQLLTMADPVAVPSARLKDQDLFKRAATILQRMGKIGGGRTFEALQIEAEDIAEGKADFNMAVLAHLFVWFPLLSPRFGVVGEGVFPKASSVRTAYNIVEAAAGRPDKKQPSSRPRAPSTNSVKEKALDGAVRVLGDLKDEWESVKETLRKVWLEDEEDQSENKSEEDELDRPIVNLPSNSGTINPRLLLRAGGIDVRRRTERKKSEGENEEQNVSGLQKKIQSVVDRMLSLKGLFVEFHKQFDNVAAEYRLADSFGKQLREKVAAFESSVLVRVAKGSQTEVLDVKEQREILRYCQVNPQRVADVWKTLTPEEASLDLPNCEELYRRNSHELKRIFRYYSTLATSATSHSGTISRWEG